MLFRLLKPILISLALVVPGLLLTGPAISNAQQNGLEDPIPETISKSDTMVELELVADDFLTSPVQLSDPNDGTSRLFVADQNGFIYIINENGELLEEPFLDLSGRLVGLGTAGTGTTNDFDERGLLGLAFHPDYNDPSSVGYGKLYTYSSQPDFEEADFTVDIPDDATFNHQGVVSEWTVSAEDPNRVNPESRRELMRIDEPQFNHDGGTIAFGPDGYLYIGLGDGGAANDSGLGHNPQIGNGQDTSNVLGTILRIEPTNPSENVSVNNVSANEAYRIPHSNPFVRTQGVDEIYAYGLRNPYRFSFDPVTQNLIVADVGQNNIEEINIVRNGGNYGWPVMEGTFAFNRETGAVRQATPSLSEGYIDPVAQYDHDEGISITGGHVYRGDAIPELYGEYVFGDFTDGGFGSPAGRLFVADLFSGEIEELQLGQQDRDLGLYVKSFGRDQDGEIYLLAGTNLGPFGTGGQIYKIVPAESSSVASPYAQ